MSTFFDVEVWSSEDEDGPWWSGEGGLSDDYSLGVAFEGSEDLADFVAEVHDEVAHLRQRRPSLQVRWFANLHTQTPADDFIAAARTAGIELP